MTPSIPPATNAGETGATNASPAGSGLAALLAALTKSSGGNGIAAQGSPDFSALLVSPAANLAKKTASAGSAPKAGRSGAPHAEGNVRRGQSGGRPIAGIDNMGTPAGDLVGAPAAEAAGMPAATIAFRIDPSAALSESGAVAEPAAKPPPAEFSRDRLEAAATLLAAFWPALSSLLSAQPPPASVNGTTVPQVAVKIGGMPAAAISLPAAATPAQLRAKLEAALVDPKSFPANPAAPAAATGASALPVEISAEQGSFKLDILLPAASSTAAQEFVPTEPTARVAPPAAPLFQRNDAQPVRLPENHALKETPPHADSAAVENIAARSGRAAGSDLSHRGVGEKNFLSPSQEPVKQDPAMAGIGVAQPPRTMPASNSVRRVAVDPSEIPSVAQADSAPALSTAAMETVAAGPAPAANPGVTPQPATPGGEIAHRAVDLVLQVVDAQQTPATPLGVVKLRFKFGSEDLAVRVHMSANGEVHTQFSSDSAELRGALNAEWHAMTAQGGGEVAGLRLSEPIFTPATPETAASFGSATDGQQFSSPEQNAQQQNQPAPIWPELRAWRRGSDPASDPVAPDAASASPVLLPTSLHLTAVA